MFNLKKVRKARKRLSIISSILFREIVNILKKTKNRPNQPKITAIDSKLEPRSR